MAPLSDGATLPRAGNVITSSGIGDNPSPIAERMEGSSVNALAEILADTSPDPIAARYSTLIRTHDGGAVSVEGGRSD